MFLPLLPTHVNEDMFGNRTTTGYVVLPSRPGQPSPATSASMTGGYCTTGYDVAGFAFNEKTLGPTDRIVERNILPQCSPSFLLAVRFPRFPFYTYSTAARVTDCQVARERYGPTWHPDTGKQASRTRTTAGALLSRHVPAACLPGSQKARRGAKQPNGCPSPAPRAAAEQKRK